jgi:Cu/Ag efflux protein CusF
MLKAFVGAVALTVAVSGAAFAADVEGKIKSVDTAEKSFTLEDGTKVWIGDSVAIDKLKEGADVKASYEEKDGKNMATSVEVSE